MPDWLSDVVESSSTVDWKTLVFRLIAALVLGLIINSIYHQTRHPSSQGGTFPTTLVLLCVLIAMVTQVIGDNVARAFSLVGALSIVRFRTVVRDTKDTAFVIFAVAVGMAVGAGQPMVAVSGMVVVGVAAFILRDGNQLLSAIERESNLTIRLNWSEALEKQALDCISKYADEIEPLSVSTVRQGAAMELVYRIRLNSAAKPTELVTELNRVEGIQTIEIHSQKTVS